MFTSDYEYMTFVARSVEGAPCTAGGMLPPNIESIWTAFEGFSCLYYH